MIEREIQIYIDRPSEFIRQNQQRLLPNWNISITCIILVLQKSNFPLENSSYEIEREKDHLRAIFLRFGSNLVFKLREFKYQSDLFDPRSGYPLLSRPGDMTLNDIALVKDLLGFNVVKQECSLLVHPEWGTAIYPSTIVTSASPEILQPFLPDLQKFSID
ncbi:MAG: methylmalonic aciduria and homocystinuria type D protein [Xenococcaceae cyanobacterium MO_188.B32]|nr:methylmalonic aciduria and homocystinuria type D protein [Xenococcaceae cyanobacterium MO_188.B32]